MKPSLFFVLIIIIGSLSSCGLPIKRDNVVKNSIRQFQSVNPTFASIISKFEQAGKQHSGDPNFKVQDVPVNFGDTENPSFEGVCFSYTDGTNEIIIRESWWKTASQSLRESLLFHELGHCALGRDHDDETVNVNGVSYKASMMNSTIVGPGQYTNFKDGYLTELFTQTKQNLLSAFNNN